MKILKEMVGWLGVLLILLAYISVTLGIFTPENILYSSMNLLGACGIIVSSYAKRDFQPILLNGVWLIVATIGIIRSLL